MLAVYIFKTIVNMLSVRKIIETDITFSSLFHPCAKTLLKFNHLHILNKIDYNNMKKKTPYYNFEFSSRVVNVFCSHKIL